MTNSILSIFFLLLSFSCMSESCYIPKDKLKIYQQKHGSKIVINKRNNTSGNIFFEIVLPGKIDNLQYSGSSLIKKNHDSGNEEFIIPLRDFIDGDIVTVSYEASPKVSQGMYINASYGNSCSVSIEHKIM